MGLEGPPFSFCKGKLGMGVTGRLSESVWKGFSSGKLMDGVSTSQSGLVGGGERQEPVTSGEAGQSSRSSGPGESSSGPFESSTGPIESFLPEAPSEVSVGAVVALNCRGSARVMR
jgi:hypothetical protein